jgi:hypothetical protein
MANISQGYVNTGGGRDQIINGQHYEQYSPQWYEAMRQDKIRNAQTTGTAAGSGAKSALDALGGLVGADTGGTGGTPTGTGASGAAGAPMPGLPPHIGGGGDLPSYGSFDSGGSTAMAPHAQLDQATVDAANSAAFGRAKDQVGETTTGALSGLRSALASRGMLGSGGEYRGTAAIATKGQQQLGDVARERAIHDSDQSADVAKANLGADVTQRGQDISSSVSKRGQNMDYTLGGRGQDITQRGQDIQAQEAAASLAMTKSLADAAQRQKILDGIMGAITQPGLY